ncbi:MAG TPA: hypothetical protein VEI06_09495 [Gemmatimonadaceae bacterium]|nr:hypothetical protein [Gemmatimonadaceae bacterium]
MTGAGDRALQDALIRLLADAPFREALASLDSPVAYAGVPVEHLAVLRSADAERVRRFARFLARQFYHERIAHFHRYARALARWTGRTPEHALGGERFTALLPKVVLGSRQTARAVAHLVADELGDSPNAPGYFGDLVRYSNAQMIIEAGPRVWSTNDLLPAVTLASRLTMTDDATVERFEWDLPAVLPALRALDAGATGAPRAPRRDIALLIARSPRGRVTVLRWSDALEAFAKILDGSSPLSDAARAAGISEQEVLAIAGALVDAGAARA